MSVRKAAAAALSMALISIPSPGFSQAPTAQFGVQITITQECKINSTTNLNFGSSGVIAADIDATSTVVVQCTSGTPYNLGLSAGAGAGATVAQRRMTGPGNATIIYSLYTTAAHNTVWGNSVGTDTQAGSGNGAAQTFTVYGRVGAQTTPAIGTYNDTVTATLTY